MSKQEFEKEINLELPNNFDNYDEKTKNSVVEYLKQLTNIEQKAYKIAMSHLGTSFNIVKSNGYNEYMKKKK